MGTTLLCTAAVGQKALTIDPGFIAPLPGDFGRSLGAVFDTSRNVHDLLIGAPEYISTGGTMSGRVERHALQPAGIGLSSSRQGAPGWRYGTVVVGNTQAVEIFYVGGPGGIGGAVCNENPTGWNCSSQTSPFGIGTDEAGDAYGTALALGDFNGDGHEDMAVGIPGKNRPLTPTINLQNVGAVHVLVGTSTPGDFSARVELDNPDSLSAGGSFGQSLAAGDLNGDGYDDLAVGEPGATVDGAGDAGRVHIFYGGQFGLSNTSPKDELDVSDFGTLSVVADLEFGHSLAIGDFDGFKCGIASCKDDLAIGVPGFTLTASVDEGAVITIPGESIGTSSAVFDILRADNFGANIVAGDRFGSFLWAGDIDGTFPMDLAIGVPDKVPTMGGTAQGAVYLAAGQGLGTLQPMQEITQLDVVEGEGKLGLIEVLSDFGASFVAADIDGDGTPDWAIGAPRHGSGDEGRVWLLLRGGIFADGFESGDVGAWSSSAP